MTLGVDLWNSHYEVLFSFLFPLSSLSLSLFLSLLQIYFLLLRQNMQENLKKLKEVNKNLRKEIRYNFRSMFFFWIYMRLHMFYVFTTVVARGLGRGWEIASSI